MELIFMAFCSPLEPTVPAFQPHIKRDSAASDIEENSISSNSRFNGSSADKDTSMSCTKLHTYLHSGGEFEYGEITDRAAAVPYCWPPLLNLPPEIVELVLSNLQQRDLVGLQLVCQALRGYLTPRIWRNVVFAFGGIVSHYSKVPRLDYYSKIGRERSSPRRCSHIVIEFTDAPYLSHKQQELEYIQNLTLEVQFYAPHEFAAHVMAQLDRLPDLEVVYVRTVIGARPFNMLGDPVYTPIIPQLLAKLRRRSVAIELEVTFDHDYMPYEEIRHAITLSESVSMVRLVNQSDCTAFASLWRIFDAAKPELEHLEIINNYFNSQLSVPWESLPHVSQVLSLHHVDLHSNSGVLLDAEELRLVYSAVQSPFIRLENTTHIASTASTFTSTPRLPTLRTMEIRKMPIPRPEELSGLLAELDRLVIDEPHFTIDPEDLGQDADVVDYAILGDALAQIVTVCLDLERLSKQQVRRLLRTAIYRHPDLRIRVMPMSAHKTYLDQSTGDDGFYRVLWDPFTSITPSITQ
ncbi:hypothetical protein TRVA0_046S00232 [Trichomonascus vanleenenianus]|uniref:F-box protein n=1 Tax=Trichomonascus vanleenenianus TaxID=2268995 RepID=UPI003EC97CC7